MTALGMAPLALGFVLAMACSQPPSSGVRGDLRYVGGPAPGNSKHLEPGRVVAYTTEGGEAGAAEFTEGSGFELILPAGTYVLIPSSGDAICPHTTVTVSEDQYETVHVRCSVV